jgi:hypothetical protein
MKNLGSPTQRAADKWDSAAFSSIFPWPVGQDRLASSFLCSQIESMPAPAPVTPTVETVEKVSFQKLIFEKWERNAKKCLVLCVPNNILAILERGVGDFYEHFSNLGFFDSLVRRPGASFCILWLVQNSKQKTAWPAAGVARMRRVTQSALVSPSPSLLRAQIARSGQVCRQ